VHLADITMFFTPHSGGVRRYLLSKQAWLARHTDLRHTIIVPAHTARANDGIVQRYARPCLSAEAIDFRYARCPGLRPY
jgi:hypothetical protein